jgi:serine/threonine protein kinase
MPLQYPGEWKFDGIGIAMPAGADRDFFELIGRIAAGHTDAQPIFESFKSAFGVQGYSTSASWAESDLSAAMGRSTDNAALYVAALWEGMEDVKRSGVSVPSAQHINKILEKWDVPLVVDPPQLRLKDGDIFVAAELAAESALTGLAYQRGAVIGQGGFGTVYRVTRQTKAGEFEFAMKVLDPSPFIKNQARALERFKREMQVLRKLQHRGIVPHIEAGVDGDRKPYILMPLIAGQDLGEALAGASADQIFAAFDEILLALAYAHGEGIVHRDLKPSNILVRTSDQQPIILDFGCAYLFDDVEQESLTTTLIGSAAYMPSEVYRNPKHRTTKQDLYACGMILYQLLMGQLPNPEDYAAIEEERSDCAGIDALVQRAIAPERKRIGTAEEFREQLQSVAQDGGS